MVVQVVPSISKLIKCNTSLLLLCFLRILFSVALVYLVSIVVWLFYVCLVSGNWNLGIMRINDYQVAEN